MKGGRLYIPSLRIAIIVATALAFVVPHQVLAIHVGRAITDCFFIIVRIFGSYCGCSGGWCGDIATATTTTPTSGGTSTPQGVAAPPGSKARAHGSQLFLLAIGMSHCCIRVVVIIIIFLVIILIWE